MQQLSQVPQMAEDGIQVGKIPRQLLAPFKNYILKIIWVTFAKFGSDPSTPWEKTPGTCEIGLSQSSTGVKEVKQKK